MDKIHRVSCIDRRGRDTSLRGDVEVIFGEPILFRSDTPPRPTRPPRLDAAVAAL